MLDRGHHLTLRGTVAGELVRDQDTRGSALLLEQLAEQTFGGLLVAPALNQDVEHDPILVDRPPQPMLLAADHQAHFVEVPLVARAWQPAPDLVGEGLAELARPLPHGLVAHVDAAGRQHLFDHAQAQREPEIQPHGMADDLAWKAVAGVGGLGCGCHAGHLPVPALPATPRPKLTVPKSVTTGPEWTWMIWPLTPKSRITFSSLPAVSSRTSSVTSATSGSGGSVRYSSEGSSWPSVYTGRSRSRRR